MSIDTKVIPLNKSRSKKINWLFFAIMILTTFIFYLGCYFTNSSLPKNIKTISLSELVQLSQKNQPNQIIIYEDFIQIQSSDIAMVANIDSSIVVSSILDFSKNNIEIRRYKNSEFWNKAFTTMFYIFLVILVVALFLTINDMTSEKSDSTKALQGLISDLKSTTENLKSDSDKVKFAPLQDSLGTLTFNDIAGSKEVKEELMEIVDFLKNPQKYKKIGAEIPKGILLIGPPGTGKTLVAKVISNEAGVPFFSISASIFHAKYVGVGSDRVRDLFATARKKKPCIVFIDEIDAIGSDRDAESKDISTLNQILTEMDGFEQHQGVIVLAATNRPKSLDKALLRAGRFDRKIKLERPEKEERKHILDIHIKSRVAKDIDLDSIATQTPGLVGGDLRNLINEAAIFAIRDNMEYITQKHLEQATDKVLIGLKRGSRKVLDHEKKVIAYHEAGHALLGHLLPNNKKVTKVSIIGHDEALGVTIFLPEKEEFLMTSKCILNEIIVTLGGRASEEIIFKDITTGSSDDIKKASKIACGLVTDYGMSKIGICNIENNSELLQAKIDEEVMCIIKNQYSEAIKTLEAHVDTLHKIANRLCEIETLSGAELEDILT